VKKNKYIPKRHRFDVGDSVKFHFAGSYRTGIVVELTKEESGHATYTVKALGIIYPCLGFDTSKEVGNVLSKA
jgi:hypothetical protein